MITLTLSRPSGYGFADATASQQNQAKAQQAQSSDTIKALQKALQGYAKIGNVPAADPGTIDGTLNPQTMIAVEAVLPQLMGRIDQTAGTALMIALPLAAVDADAEARAKAVITQIAPELTAAVIALTVNATGSKPTTPTPSGPVTLPANKAFWQIVQNRGRALPPSPIAPTVPGGVPSPDQLPMPPMTVPWYKTWWGLTAIGVGAVSLLILAVRR